MACKDSAEDSALPEVHAVTRTCRKPRTGAAGGGGQGPRVPRGAGGGRSPCWPGCWCTALRPTAPAGPKLALDLEGGTQMVLRPSLQGSRRGRRSPRSSLDEVVEMIRQRVDGAGVSEAEDHHPVRQQHRGVPAGHAVRGRPVRAIQTSAQILAFRPVIVTGPGSHPQGVVHRTARTCPRPEPAPRLLGPPLDHPRAVRRARSPRLQRTPAAEGPGDPASGQGHRGVRSPGQRQVTSGPGGDPLAWSIEDASHAPATNSLQGSATGGYAVNLQFNEQGTETFKQLGSGSRRLRPGRPAGPPLAVRDRPGRFGGLAPPRLRDLRRQGPDHG
ncbi:hypothetical protein QJS66_04255 [Kocuria rhizophila]|nr:hypothetical protein QJS66_04255 [Kocuria rhizophila]